MMNEFTPAAQIPLNFQDFALSTIKSGQPIPENTTKYHSPERQARVGIPNVEPDGVLPLVVIVPPNTPARYAESVFYEVKIACEIPSAPSSNIFSFTTPEMLLS